MIYASIAFGHSVSYIFFQEWKKSTEKFNFNMQKKLFSLSKIKNPVSGFQVWK